MAEWADEARRKDGVVVIPHFPNPYCEVAADIVQGKIDAVEINMQALADPDRRVVPLPQLRLPRGRRGRARTR